MIVIPPNKLDTEVLTALIEEFVLQEGTEYGEMEFALAQKVAQVRRSIGEGKVIITYDATMEQCNLLTEAEFKKHRNINKNI